MKREPTTRRWPLVRVLVVAACLWGLAAPAAGQKAPPEPKAENLHRLKVLDTTRTIRIYSLKYADCESVVRIVQGLFAGGTDETRPLRLVADERTNVLIVLATAPQYAKLEAILKEVDVPWEAPQTIRVYRLKHAKADKLGAAVLPLLGPRGTLSRDMERNLLIIKDVSNVQQTAARLIEILDVPATAGAMTQRRVRVVWMVAGLEDKPRGKLPADLKDVEAELAKSGVEGLQVVAQFLTRCVGTEEFAAGGHAELNGPCEVNVEGQFVERSATEVGLKIQIMARQELRGDAKRQPGRRECVDIATVESTITAPPGHAVVLAMTPMGKLTSVFVVTLYEGDAAPAPGRTAAPSKKRYRPVTPAPKARD
jgi:hypothetical protein